MGSDWPQSVIPVASESLSKQSNVSKIYKKNLLSSQDWVKSSLVVLAVVSYLGHSKKILIDWLVPKLGTVQPTTLESIQVKGAQTEDKPSIFFWVL